MLPILLSLAFFDAAPLHLLSDCSDSAARIEVASSRGVKVLSSYAGDRTCYSLVVDTDAGQVRGYTTNRDLPAVRAFEQDRRNSFASTLIVPKPPPPPAAEVAAAAPKVAKPLTAAPAVEVDNGPFEFARRDVRGRHLTLSEYRGRGTLLFFWSPKQLASRKLLPEMRVPVHALRRQSVRVLGISEVASEGEVQAIDQSDPLPYEQIADDGQLERKFRVPSVPYFVLLDSQRMIVATGGSLAAMQSAAAQLPR